MWGNIQANRCGLAPPDWLAFSNQPFGSPGNDFNIFNIPLLICSCFCQPATFSTLLVSYHFFVRRFIIVQCVYAANNLVRMVKSCADHWNLVGRPLIRGGVNYSSRQPGNQAFLLPPFTLVSNQQNANLIRVSCKNYFLCTYVWLFVPKFGESTLHICGFFNNGQIKHFTFKTPSK